MVEHVAVIIPSLNPDEKLIAVVEGVIDKGFKNVILVNDGSDKEHLGPFQTAEEKYPGICKVLTHEVNKGKGRAVKTAFRYILDERPDIEGVIVVDGDNQHKSADILACSEKMLELKDQVVIGCRDFSSKEIPWRSRFGNKTTRIVLRYACSVKISDTQTGLRAIPRRYLEDMIEVKGERYEYETNQLLSFRELGIRFTEVPIETVYINDNESSHFHPIRDSIKIYSVILKFMSASFLSCLIDLGLYTLLVLLFKNIFADNAAVDQKMQITLATVGARIVSSLFNFFVNMKVVFRAKSGMGGCMLRYYILAVCQMALSAFGVSGLTKLLNWSNGLSVVVKLVVDTCLYFVSFYIQRTWVFGNKAKKQA